MQNSGFDKLWRAAVVALLAISLMAAVTGITPAQSTVVATSGQATSLPGALMAYSGTEIADSSSGTFSGRIVLLNGGRPLVLTFSATGPGRDPSDHFGGLRWYSHEMWVTEKDAERSNVRPGLYRVTVLVRDDEVVLTVDGPPGPFDRLNATDDSPSVGEGPLETCEFAVDLDRESVAVRRTK